MDFVGKPFQKILEIPLAGDEILRLVQVEMHYQHWEAGGWVRQEALDLMFAMSHHRGRLGKCGFATQGRMRRADPKTVRANMKLHGSAEVGAGMVARVGHGCCGLGAFRFVQELPLMMRTAFHWTESDLAIDPVKNVMVWELEVAEELANPIEQGWRNISHPHIGASVGAVKVWSLRARARLMDEGDREDTVLMWV